MNTKFTIVIMALCITLFLSVGIAVSFGTVDIKVHEVYTIFWGHLTGNIADLQEPANDIVWLIRLPRLLLACGVGTGLAVCGVVMQAIIKNPLADPYILGISSGASLGATLAILLGIGASFGSNYIGISAFIGAFVVSVGVLFISSLGSPSNSIKLLLAGLALSSVCSAFSGFIIYLANDKAGIQSITFWLMGSLAGAKWEMLQIIIPVVLLLTMFFWTQSRILNLMLLGDEVAVTLGTSLCKYRHAYLLLSSLIVGFVVYAAGMIGFVGLIVPHVVRMMSGTDHKKTIPLCALIGAIFLVWADVLCRVVVPRAELPIGMLISMIGAPFFVYLMVKKSYDFGGSN